MVSLALGDSYEVKMKNIIIAGSGPVGSFMAVLCAQLGFPVTVYEKREGFTRNINVKIEWPFFKEVQEVLSRLNVKTEFFAELNEYLHKQKNLVFAILSLTRLLTFTRFCIKSFIIGFDIPITFCYFFLINIIQFKFLL